jgi:hypothetical protein
MNTPEPAPAERAAIASVLRDAHFWVPVIVLLAGLVLLRWVS